MVKQNWKPYVFFITLAEGIGLLSGWLSREGTQTYAQIPAKPPLSPPGWVFPLVWTVLFALMGYGAARVYQTEPGKNRSRGLNLFVIQLIVNFFWSPIFFNAQAYGFAFLWLLLLMGLVLAMTWAFWQTDKTAALAQIPYILWLLFAAYLNYGVWQLNR